MNRILITFGGSTYDHITEKTVAAVPSLGADKLWVYDDRWLLATDFYQMNEWLWQHKGVGNPTGGRGFGWFCWKPFIILHALEHVSDGDIVMFLDADTYPVADFNVLYHECHKIGGHMAFMATARTGPLRNADWNKRDCFIVMAQDYPKYHDAGTAVARFMLFQKGPWHVKQFLMEWLAYCLNPSAQTFEPSQIKPEYPSGAVDVPGFREHRTEQAIYTNLCHKYGRKLYREACDFGKDCPQDWDLYPTLFKQVHVSGPKSLTGSRFRNAPE